MVKIVVEGEIWHTSFFSTLSLNRLYTRGSSHSLSCWSLGSVCWSTYTECALQQYLPVV